MFKVVQMFVNVQKKYVAEFLLKWKDWVFALRGLKSLSFFFISLREYKLLV